MKTLRFTRDNQDVGSFLSVLGFLRETGLLMAWVDQLEAQQQERDKLAEAFAKACVSSFTGTTQLERPEKMKATEEAR